MQSSEPGYDPGKSSSGATGQKKVAERLLSFVGPRTAFAVIFAGILVSAALILAAFSTGRGGLAVKSLTSMAGFTNSSAGRVIDPVNGKCPLNYRLDALTRKCILPLPPEPTPPAPTRALKLDVGFTPTVVAPGGSYTFSASYVDTNGATQKYSGLLDVQLRLCQIANPSSCQSSTGPWGDYNVTNGSIVINLPTTIGEGIYNASFIPRGQPGWTWSNEAAVTVQATSVTPPTGGQKIRPISANASRATYGSAMNAIDDNINTTWNSGDGAPQWIELDLGQYYSVSSMRFNVEKTPGGEATHQIYAGACPTPTSLATTFTENLTSKQWKDVSFSAASVRYVRVLTTASPSWIAWNEIETYGTSATFTGSCDGGTPPSPVGCLTGSVNLYSNNIAVGTTTTASSSVPGVAVTYESNNQSIATVNGTTITAGNTAGTATISGRFVYAGRTCYLTSATLTVTGGNAQGTVSANPTDVYLCTSNGTSNQATVTVAVTRGSGKVDVSGAVTFSGPNRLDAPNTWTQVISPGNFTGLNATANGQASVTISLKDYFTGQTIASKTITARINPPSNCPQAGQSSLTVGTVYAACSSSLSATADSIQATSGTGSTSRVLGNGRMLFALDPNGSASQSNVSIGYATDGNSISFTLVEDGSNRVLAGPVTKIVQPNPACSPTGTITPNTSYVSTCALSGRPASVTLSAAITTPFGEGDIVVGTGSYPGASFGHVVANGGPKTFTVSASQMDMYSGVTFNIRSTSGSLVSGAGAVVYRDDRNCNTSTPTGTITVTPSTLALCPGQSGQVTVSVTSNAPGVIGAGGVIFGNFNAPGDSWQRTVTETTTFSGNVGGLSPVAMASKNVTVTQASNCATTTPTYDFILTANDTTVCAVTNDTALIAFNASAANIPDSYQASGNDQVIVSKDGQIVYAKGFVSVQPGSYVAAGSYSATTTGVYSVAMTFNGQLRGGTPRLVNVSQNCPTATPSYDLNVTANDTTVCPIINDNASINMAATAFDMPAGYVSTNADSLTVAKDGQIVFNHGFVQGNPGNWTASGSYTATTPGTYSVAMNFNGQLRQIRQIVITQNCPAPTGSLSVSGGTVPCNSTNGLVNISISGQDGVQYSVARSGGWYYNTTGSGSTTDIVPLGTTYTYSLSAGSQYLGSKSVTGVSDSNCGGAGHISVDSTTLILARQPVFPYACGIARQGSITATNSGNVNLTFSAGGVSYLITPGQTRTGNMWYTSAGTYTHRLVTESTGQQVDSVSVNVSCVN